MKREENYKGIGGVGEERRDGASRNSGGVGEGSGKQAIEELRNEVLSPLENDIQKLRDPVVLAAIMHTAATERESTNRLLKTLIEKLDAKFSEVDARLARIEKQSAAPAAAAGQEEVLLPSVDEEILKFVREKRHASAEEVRKKFGYKGKNAASARLSRMYDMGLLDKKQVGRAVLYCAKSS
jgi:DNA-binding transcriptional ArsR family regulator